MSLKTGQYTQPLNRPAFVQDPVVAGFTTMRLWAGLQMSGTGTSPSLTDNLVLATLENTGDVSVTAQFRQVGDYSSGLPAYNAVLTDGIIATPGSGTKAQTAPYRSNLGSTHTLVPGGRKTISFTPTQQYVELWGVSGGPSQIKLQLDTQVPWTLLGFAKNDPTYPPALWQPPTYNPPTT
jgi:hypothetical protein